MHYISKQARKTRGVWGDAPPDKFLLLLGPFLDKSRTVVATVSSNFWLSYMHFAKPADFKFPREKALWLAEQ